LGIEDTFDAIVDGNMVVHSKPDPEIFLLAARQLGMEPESCVVFEDAEAGVDAALAAGMKCVGVGSPARLGHAHIVIKNTGEFEIPILNEL
jgi:beta-phosphoglucomutase